MTIHKTEKKIHAIFTANPKALRVAQVALIEHLRRKDRIENPDGEFDKAGRWYPSGLDDTAEMGVRSPSRDYPYSYMTRCRTLEHCELIHDADHDDVLALRAYYKFAQLDPTLMGDRAKAWEALKIVLAAIGADLTDITARKASRTKPKAARSVRAAAATGNDQEASA